VELFLDRFRGKFRFTSYCGSCSNQLHFGKLFLVLLWVSYSINFVFYGYETWSLTLREEPRLRVFEKRVLRRIFGPKRDEVTEDWRKLYNGEFCNLCSSPFE
jgi:hypothetical protein